ncbi:hypothetical protein D3C78_1423110 [compost metagenome]
MLCRDFPQARFQRFKTGRQTQAHIEPLAVHGPQFPRPAVTAGGSFAARKAGHRLQCHIWKPPVMPYKTGPCGSQGPVEIISCWRVFPPRPHPADHPRQHRDWRRKQPSQPRSCASGAHWRCALPASWQRRGRRCHRQRNKGHPCARDWQRPQAPPGPDWR